MDNWSLYYKIDPQSLRRETTQMVYEPKINKDKTIFCMDFLWPSEYQYKQTKLYHSLYTDDFVDYMFKREIKYLELYKNYNWSPVVLDIDERKRQIFIKWETKTCNDLIYQNRDKSTIDHCILKFKEMLQEQIQIGLYKLSMYPHSHYIDSCGEIHAIDFYACSTDLDRWVSEDKIRPLLGDSSFRFKSCLVDNQYDLRKFFKETLLYYNQWPKNVTGDIYEKFFR
jgi:hypothetical protein